MDTSRLLVYVVTPDEIHYQPVIEALQYATKHEYVTLTTLDELYQRLRRGSIRPRLILLDDGPPTSQAWVGARICQYIHRNFEDPPPVIVCTTDLRRSQLGDAHYQTDLTRSGAVMTIKQPAPITRYVAAIDTFNRSR